MKENSSEKHNIVSFGIMEEEDIDLLLKQKRKDLLLKLQ